LADAGSASSRSELEPLPQTVFSSDVAGPRVKPGRGLPKLEALVKVGGWVGRVTVWSRHVGDPILESNRTRRVDFALFMVEALTKDELVHEAPAIVGRLTPSALAHACEP
jgi:hypothetical protein